MPRLTHWLAARATWLCDASISYIISGTHWSDWSSCKWGLIGTCGWWKYMDLIPYKWYNQNPIFLMMNLIQYNSLVLLYIIHQAAVALRCFTVESTEICGYVWYMQCPHLRTTCIYIYIHIIIYIYTVSLYIYIWNWWNWYKYIYVHSSLVFYCLLRRFIRATYFLSNQAGLSQKEPQKSSKNRGLPS